jgi:hypothetical protein
VLGVNPTTSNAQSSCQLDANGNRLPNQWCSGDVFLGLGETKYVQQFDANDNPILDEYGNPVWTYVVENGGQFKVVNSRAVAQQNDVILDSGLGLTPACAVDAETGDLWTAGDWTNRISHIRAPTGGAGHQLLGSIDLSSHTPTSGCSDYGWARPGCGAVRSIVFDRSGNLYVGTDFGTNKIFKVSKDGTLLDTYTVPVSPDLRGPGWIDLAADQETMFYTAALGTIGVFNINREALPEALFDAGVEHVTDPVLDPNNVGLFGKIVVKSEEGTPWTGTLIHRMRLLPPGDGTGGFLVVYDAMIARVNLTGFVVQGYSPEWIYPVSSLDITPDGKSFWMMTKANATWTSPSKIAKVHIPTGVTDVDPVTGPGWTAVRGLCVNRAHSGGHSARLHRQSVELLVPTAPELPSRRSRP